MRTCGAPAGPGIIFSSIGGEGSTGVSEPAFIRLTCVSVAVVTSILPLGIDFMSCSRAGLNSGLTWASGSLGASEAADAFEGAWLKLMGARHADAASPVPTASISLRVSVADFLMKFLQNARAKFVGARFPNAACFCQKWGRETETQMLSERKASNSLWQRFGSRARLVKEFSPKLRGQSRSRSQI